MIEKLFESLDEKVFTDELKESLSATFNEAVEAKSVELAEAKVAEKEVELQEAFDAQKEEMLKEAAEKEEALLEQVDAYLEKVVDDFIVEAKEQLGESIKAEKADLMVEAFESMLVAGGVDVAKIVEAKEDGSVEAQLEESVSKYDALVEENIALEKENEALIKMGVIAEMKEGLSIVEAEKFTKLAAIVEFSKDEEYANKLETIKESVKGAKAEPAKVEENLNEDVKSYSHLL